MTIFTEDDLADTPILTEWQIVGGRRSQPQLFGVHAFHEGARVSAGHMRPLYAQQLSETGAVA